MFRHGCTTINFNWILIRQRWFSSLLNTTRKACLSLSLSIWIESRFIFLQLSATWASPSTRISLFSKMSPASVKSAILNCIESILSVTTCPHDALKTLISALVPSRIDYCNSLLAGCPKQLIHKLKKVQNNAARLICRIPVLSNISRPSHSSLASCWTKNLIQIASPCL